MTLMSTLKGLTNFELRFMNFSSSTTPKLLLKLFEQYCEYVKIQGRVVLRPKQLTKNIVLFCDEINLPEIDAYGTQPVISFLRQLIERRGFWRARDHQ